MTKIISTINIKGGVGKTTTTGCLAEIIADLGLRVLVVDSDPQANSSQLFRRYQTSEKTINDLFLLVGNDVNVDNVKQCIQKTEYENIDIIASSEVLSFTCNTITFDTSRAQQLILKKALKTIQDEYDFILIDNTPFFNILTINALTASHFVLTPVAANGYSFDGLARLLSEIYRIKDEFNEDLIFIGAFMANVNVRKVVVKDLYESYKQELGEKFITQYIRQDKNVDESNTAFIPLLSYNKNCNAVNDYKRLLASLHILDTPEQALLEKCIKEE